MSEILERLEKIRKEARYKIIPLDPPITFVTIEEDDFEWLIRTITEELKGKISDEETSE